MSLFLVLGPFFNVFLIVLCQPERNCLLREKANKTSSEMISFCDLVGC